MRWGDYGWGMGFGWFFMVLFWILVILGIVYVVQAVAGRGKRSEKQETSLDILKKRYARGEITKEKRGEIK